MLLRPLIHLEESCRVSEVKWIESVIDEVGTHWLFSELKPAMRKIVGAFLDMSALPHFGHARCATSTHINSNTSDPHPLLHNL